MSATSSEHAVRAANDLCYEFISGTCDLAASYARSAGEASFRGDHRTLGIHLAQLRLTVIEALKSYKEITPAGVEKAEAA
jgi:hypothetical protein